MSKNTNRDPGKAATSARPRPKEKVDKNSASKNQSPYERRHKGDRPPLSDFGLASFVFDRLREGDSVVDIEKAVSASDRFRGIDFRRQDVYYLIRGHARAKRLTFTVPKNESLKLELEGIRVDTRAVEGNHPTRRNRCRLHGGERHRVGYRQEAHRNVEGAQSLQKG